MRALFVQHQDDAPAGVLGTWARERGIATTIVRPDRGGPLPDPRGVDFVALLGSDAFAVRGEQAWVDDELAWLGTVVDAAVPVLGICFGAQALAVTLDGGRWRTPRPEIGWIEVGTDDAGLVPSGPWMAWHRDVIEPPPGARVVAFNATGVQAFTHGPHLGLQFHPEVTTPLLDAWAARGRRLADEPRVGRALAVAQAAGHADRSGVAARRLFDGFLQHAGLTRAATRHFAGGLA